MWLSSQVLRLANCLWLRLFLNISTFFSLGDKLFLSDSFQNKLLDSFLYILNLGYFRYFFHFSFRYHLYYKHLHITLQFSGEHPTYQTCLVRFWMLPSHPTLFLSSFLFFSFLFFFFFFPVQMFNFEKAHQTYTCKSCADGQFPLSFGSTSACLVSNFFLVH